MTEKDSQSKRVFWDEETYSRIINHIIDNQLPVGRKLGSSILAAQQAILPPSQHRPKSSLMSQSVLDVFRKRLEQRNTADTPSPAPSDPSFAQTESAGMPGAVWDDSHDDADTNTEHNDPERAVIQKEAGPEIVAPAPVIQKVETENPLRQAGLSEGIKDSIALISRKIGILLAESIIQATMDHIESNMAARLSAIQTSKTEKLVLPERRVKRTIMVQRGSHDRKPGSFEARKAVEAIFAK